MQFVGNLPPPGNAAPERPGRIEYLYLTPKQARLAAELDDAIDDLPPAVRLRCLTPDVVERNGKTILLFPHMDYDERTPPSREEARLMCTTSGVICPVAEQCLALGLAQAAPVGVWGGHVLVDGQLQYKEDTHG